MKIPMKLVDCARDTTTTIGAGDIALNGQPPIGAQSLSAFDIGESFEYKVSSITRNEWEVCVGHRVSALSIRCTEVISSSANGAKISFTAGVKDVFATISARSLSRLGQPGQDGLDGRDGVDGVDGKDGADGRDGVDGRDGTDGIDGLDGAPGADGQPLDLASLPIADAVGAGDSTSLVIIKDGGAEQIPLDSIGISLADLPSLASLSDTDLIAVARPGVGDYKITCAVLKAYADGTTAPPADSTAPVFPDALTSANVTQTEFTLGWSAATDASGIARYEYSYDNSTWTTAGTALSVNLTGRTAGTTYTMRVRALDPSGNASTVRTLVVVTLANSGDTQAPVMSGSINIANQTSSGYTKNWSAATDNVGFDHYESSIDNGASWQNMGTATSRVVTGRPAATTDNVRVRAHDAAGNISNVLTGTATTSPTAPVKQYTVRTINPDGTAISGAAFPSGSATFAGSSSDLYAGGSGLRVQVLDANGNAPDSVKFVWGKSPTVPPAGVTFASTTLPAGATGNVLDRPTGIATSSNYGNWTQADRNSFYGVFGISGSLFCWDAAAGIVDHLRYPMIITPDGGVFPLDNGAGPVGRQVLAP